jgi:predicted small metal-binding protein
MTSDDRIEFAKSLSAMAAAFDMEVDEAVAEGFWITLGDLPLDRVQAAIKQVMRSCKFRPKASEIREIVVEQMEHEARLAHREERIVRDYATALAGSIIRQMRKESRTDEEIRDKLRLESIRLDIPLAWPGEEPWNQRSTLPKLELKRP